MPVFGPQEVCAVTDCVGPCGGINDVELGVHANDGAECFIGFAGKVFLSDVPNCLVSEAVSAQGQECPKEGQGKVIRAF